MPMPRSLRAAAIPMRHTWHDPQALRPCPSQTTPAITIASNTWFSGPECPQLRGEPLAGPRSFGLSKETDLLVS
jgi:hypothetical protein